MRVDHLLRGVTQARDERELEARLMDGLAAPFGARAVGFYLLGGNCRPTRIAVRGVDECFVADYEALGRAVDPVMQHVRTRHAPAHERSLLSGDGWHRCALYQEVSSRYRLEHVMEGPVVADGRLVGTVNVARGPHEASFGDDDLRELTALCLHLSARVALIRSGPQLTEVRLSSRELEVLRLVARGLTNAEIGAELGVTPHAVKQSLRRMSTKLGVRGRAALVAQARDQ